MNWRREFVFSAFPMPCALGGGVTSAKLTEREARVEAYDYALLFLNNDPKRTSVEVSIRLDCWACEGDGKYAVKGKRSVFGTFKPCCVCKGSGVEFEIPAYSVTRP